MESQRNLKELLKIKNLLPTVLSAIFVFLIVGSFSYLIFFKVLLFISFPLVFLLIMLLISKTSRNIETSFKVFILLSVFALLDINLYYKYALYLLMVFYLIITYFKIKELKISPPEFFVFIIFLYILSSFISAFLSEHNFAKALIYSTGYSITLISILAISFALSHDSILNIFKFTILAALIPALVLILLQIPPLRELPFERYDFGILFFPVFFHPNSLGLIFSYSIPIVIYFWLENIKIKFVNLEINPLLLLIIFSIFLSISVSRTSILSLFIFCIFLGILWKEKRKKILSFLAIYFLFIICGILIIYFSIPAPKKHFFSLWKLGLGLTKRDILWSHTLKIIKENWITGIGPGNIFETLALSLRRIPIFSHLTSISPHNTYLRILAENGIIGLSLYLGALIYIIWSFLIQRKLFKINLVKLLSSVFFMILIRQAFETNSFGGLEFDSVYFLIYSFLLVRTIKDTTIIPMEQAIKEKI